MRRLGEAHKAAGQLEEAEVVLRDVLRHHLPLPEKLQVLALLADVQLKEDSAELEVKVQQRLQENIKEAGGDVSKVCKWEECLHRPDNKNKNFLIQSRNSCTASIPRSIVQCIIRIIP